MPGSGLGRGACARKVPWRWIMLGESGFPLIFLLFAPLLASPVVRGLWLMLVDWQPLLDVLAPYLLALLLLALVLPIALRLSNWIRGWNDGESASLIVERMDRRRRS